MCDDVSFKVCRLQKTFESHHDYDLELEKKILKKCSGMLV